MPDSLSQINRRGTAPKDPINSHIPANRSPVIREGSIRAMMNRECEHTITNTGRTRGFPLPTGMRLWQE
jgi:hypothetical protein